MMLELYYKPLHCYLVECHFEMKSICRFCLLKWFPMLPVLVLRNYRCCGTVNGDTRLIFPVFKYRQLTVFGLVFLK